MLELVVLVLLVAVLAGVAFRDPIVGLAIVIALLVLFALRGL